MYFSKKLNFYTLVTLLTTMPETTFIGIQFLLESNPDKFEQDVLAGIIDINAQNQHGGGLLHCIPNGSSKYRIARLIKLGINLDMTDEGGNTWLHGRNYKVVWAFYELIKDSLGEKSELHSKIKFNPNILNSTGRHILGIWDVKPCITDFLTYNHVFSEPLNMSILPKHARKIYNAINKVDIHIGDSFVRINRATFDQIPEVKALHNEIASCKKIIAEKSEIINTHCKDMEKIDSTLQAENDKLIEQLSKLKVILGL